MADRWSRLGRAGAGMKVVVTDYTFPSLEIEEAIVRGEGIEVVSGQCKTAETLIPLVSDADAVITQFAPVKDAMSSRP